MTFVTQENYKKNFKGFIVSVEYTPEKLKDNKKYFPNESVTCYKQNNSELKSIKMNFECNTTVAGNQIRITLSQNPAQLVLCDARIYGECGNGKYGENCSKICSVNCLGECDKVNGTCFACKPGWRGLMCTKECENGTFGEKCSNQCSENCLNLCDKTNGTCSACKSGWRGLMCMEECGNGTYGENCSNQCSENCLNHCDKMYGTCIFCKSGWRGLMCTEECGNGRYGQNCSNKCSENCLNHCDKINGSCFSCKAGWRGLMCTEGRTKGDLDPIASDNEIPMLRLISICLGFFSMIVFVYATVITVLFKRKTVHNAHWVMKGQGLEQKTKATSTKLKNDDSNAYTGLSQHTRDAGGIYEYIQME